MQVDISKSFPEQVPGSPSWLVPLHVLVLLRTPILQVALQAPQINQWDQLYSETRAVFVLNSLVSKNSQGLL